ncbi:MAG: hypothetical protein WCI72_01300 [archaeon]
MNKSDMLLEDRLANIFHCQRSILQESLDRLNEKQVFYSQQENKQSVINQLEKYAHFPKGQTIDRDKLTQLDGDLEHFGLAKFSPCGSYGGDWDYGDSEFFPHLTPLGFEILKNYLEVKNE